MIFFSSHTNSRLDIQKEIQTAQILFQRQPIYFKKNSTTFFKHFFLSYFPFEHVIVILLCK